ncbi:hypothetical protein RINTHH_19910 [Richelia intracellularis HH01]|uniref:Uncharacterized protein n=1 Tax=Richelia intracellularis HH01 TaxID=1165094 RepID=M1X6H7_9NOST|nr:hypothetical protein RINTHH_19910 [Richelia intracellularis HH01]
MTERVTVGLQLQALKKNWLFYILYNQDSLSNRILHLAR